MLQLYVKNLAPGYLEQITDLEKCIHFEHQPRTAGIMGWARVLICITLINAKSRQLVS